MQKQFGLITIYFTLLISAAPLNADDALVKIAKLEKDAMKMVKEFAGTLKPQLKESMQKGGPLHAIEVCSRQAPAIAQRLTDESDWIVKRVSLKARNHTTATADVWESEILRQFDQRQQQGEDPATITHSEVVNGQFRFMKAQAVEPVCLVCHGQHIPPDVAALLDKKYPDDIARGYDLGQIRGAISLSREL